MGAAGVHRHSLLDAAGNLIMGLAAEIFSNRYTGRLYFFSVPIQQLCKRFCQHEFSIKGNAPLPGIHFAVRDHFPVLYKSHFQKEFDRDRLFILRNRI